MILTNEQLARLGAKEVAVKAHFYDLVDAEAATSLLYDLGYTTDDSTSFRSQDYSWSIWRFTADRPVVHTVTVFWHNKSLRPKHLPVNLSRATVAQGRESTTNGNHVYPPVFD